MSNSNNLKTFVPAKLLRNWLIQRDAIKGFLLNGAFVILYCAVQTVRSDWIFARGTLDLYELARANADVTQYTSRTSLQSIIEFLELDCGKLTAHLKKACKDCDIAIANVDNAAWDMDLSHLICSDFEPRSASGRYHSRDCATVDEAFAMAPAADGAPCCNNQTLFQASLSVMVWTAFHPELVQDNFMSTGKLSLQDLLDIDATLASGRPKFGDTGLIQRKKILENIAAQVPLNTQHAGTHFFVKNAVDAGFIAQVVINRNEHMLGIQNKAAWLDKVAAPDYVEPSQTYWSLNFTTTKDHRGWIVVMWLFWVWTLLHEACGYYSRCITLWELCEELLNPYSLFFLVTTFSPFFSEVLRSELSVVQWTLWTSINQGLLGLRCFDEGQHVSNGIGVVVFTVKEAFILLKSLMLVTLFMAFVLMLIYGQLFGLVDDDLAFGTWGLARNVQQLVAPASLEESHVSQMKSGALLFYYWSLFMFRIAFGSFIVAALVGAFNKTRAAQEKHEKDADTFTEGYERRGRDVVHRRDPFTIAMQMVRKLAAILWYLLTWRDYGCFVPRLKRRLLRLSRELGDADGSCLMYPNEVLIERLGEYTANHLVADFAFVRSQKLKVSPRCQTAGFQAAEHLDEQLEMAELQLAQALSQLAHARAAIRSTRGIVKAIEDEPAVNHNVTAEEV